MWVIYSVFNFKYYFLIKLQKKNEIALFLLSGNLHDEIDYKRFSRFFKTFLVILNFFSSIACLTQSFLCRLIKINIFTKIRAIKSKGF